jgi:hypothetical protein
VTVFLCAAAGCDTAAESIRPEQTVTAAVPAYSFTGLRPGTYVVGGVRSTTPPETSEQSFTVNATGGIDVPPGGSLDLRFPNIPGPGP